METTGIVNDIVDEIVTCGRVCIVGRIVFSLCPFPDESADVNQS